MQNINIDRSIAIIEATLKDRHCLKELVFLAKKYPESINSFISLAESIEEDLNSRDGLVRVTEKREQYAAFFVLENVSAMLPKGRFSVAFCETCFYLDSLSRQVRIDYSNILSILSIGSLEMKNVINLVIALKAPLVMGKRKIDCVCLSLDSVTPKETYFTDKKRKVSGKDYSIFVTILKTKFSFTLIKPDSMFFISSERTAYVKCYHGTSPCWLVPCRPGLVIVTSSNVHYVPHKDVIAMNLDRLGGGTFDFTVKTRKKKQYDFTMVAREEQPCLEEYSKLIIKENRLRQGGKEVNEVEEDSSDEAFSAQSDDESDKEKDAEALRHLVKDASGDEISEVESNSDERPSKRIRI